MLAVAVALTFAPALTAGFLGYDDDWLVQHNPVLSRGDLGALGPIFGRFDLEGRLELGGEFLPVRDVVVWLLWGVLKLPVEALHAAQLGLYVLAALAFRRALALTFGASRFAELAAFFFAVHPVHAESVVWLAGMKDVLALLFTGSAMAAYAARGRVSWIVTLTLLACFSKSVSVVVPLLLLLIDYAMARRPRWSVVAGAGLVASCALVVHLHVGGIVGMLAEPIGGSRLTAAASMLVVVVRYIGLSFFVHPHAVIYEVAPLGFDSALVWGAALLLAAIAGLAVFAHRRGLRAPGFAALIFAVALAPVSQVFAPLQNQMADRYLMLAVLGPMVALSYAVTCLLSRARLAQLRAPLSAVLVVLVGLLGFSRARAYADPVLLFYEATERTKANPRGPYQLAMVLEARGDEESAETFFRVAYARGLGTESGRRAGNNLGRLLYRQGRVVEALALYRELREVYPDDARVLFNVSRVLRALGEEEEADALMDELRARFPRYEEERLIERHGPQPRRW
jgi:protein O-mannosyl-transferase